MMSNFELSHLYFTYFWTIIELAFYEEENTVSNTLYDFIMKGFGNNGIDIVWRVSLIEGAMKWMKDIEDGRCHNRKYMEYDRHEYYGREV